MICFRRDNHIVIRGKRNEQWLARKDETGITFRNHVDSGALATAAIAEFVGASVWEVRNVIDVLKRQGHLPPELISEVDE